MSRIRLPGIARPTLRVRRLPAEYGSLGGFAERQKYSPWRLFFAC